MDRLERIRKYWSKCESPLCDLVRSDINWLIAKVERLQAANKTMTCNTCANWDDVDSLAKRIKKPILLSLLESFHDLADTKDTINEIIAYLKAKEDV